MPADPPAGHGPSWRELTGGPRPVVWVKATASGTGNCVEAAAGGGLVLVRDSKDPGPVLALTPAAWRGLLEVARSGCLDVLGR